MTAKRNDWLIDRREFGVRFLKLAGLLAAPGIAATGMGHAMQARGRYDVVAEHDVMVPMRDGVLLASDIYRPANGETSLAGPFPVILERTPYGKSSPATRHASIEVAHEFASHGYVVVFQDCRGRGNSQGEYVKYLSDAEDGFDCCAWIIDQSWSNGRIGTMGLSYAAHTQAALASVGAPGVAAMVMDSGGFSSAYQGGIRQGGAFELKQVTWAFRQVVNAPEIRDDPEKLAAIQAIDIKEWFSKMPWSRGNSPLSLVPEYEDYVFDQWEHGHFDEFWEQPGIYAAGYYKEFPEAATMMISSWYDPYPRTVIENYLGLKAHKKGPHRLVLGPWTHGNRETTYSGDVDFGPDAAFSKSIATGYVDFKRRWFDEFLKNDSIGVAQEPELRLFVMGGGTGRRNENGKLDHGGHWRDEKSWPIDRAENTALYLHGNGLLSEEKSARDMPERRFDYDPTHPVPTIGGTVTSGQPIMVGGAFDQREAPEFYGAREPYRPLSERDDILSFETKSLETDVEVTGAIEAELWISSNCTDTDFTIKLIDVYPPNEDYADGYAMNVTDGILRCRYRASWKKPRMMQPGKVYRIKVEAFPTSNLFKAGHKIRLDISSSNFPHFDINTNTGEPEGQATTTRVATNRVYMDKKHPSHVTLPIVPVRA